MMKVLNECCDFTTIKLKNCSSQLKKILFKNRANPGEVSTDSNSIKQIKNTMLVATVKNSEKNVK